MIELYYDATPNGRKILLALEEMGLVYTTRWVRLDRGEQFSETYRALSPSAKMPALVHHMDGETTTLFESGAILVYLAELSGRLLPADAAARARTLSWLFWQTSTFGPAVGQATHFHSYAPAAGHSDSYAADRFAKISRNLYADLDRHLSDREFLTNALSIADLAVFPWVRVARGHGIDLSKFPHVTRWSEGIASRPSAAVKPIPDDRDVPFKTYSAHADETWKTLFANETGGW
ncbi:glutathione S-transferase N-terminal domain-containing protein [Pacificimonas sp. WHA3]|uniref:Glutathione S-transferase N-terminal domain-containing protein n=1 Tax=Pacificimonas pallii TaxID=2827236 RepID=A0ABS6SCI5_9SPHN|nr:glutathione S-transferase N-terminal domain-containing protein [Pacificimonas pallii]MBV7256134.1 glutathione S-transferase N-terminal domain-containing protein [Pacificimonas pallii]